MMALEKLSHKHLASKEKSCLLQSSYNSKLIYLQGDEFPITGGIQGEVMLQKRVTVPFNMERLWLNETQGLLNKSFRPPSLGILKHKPLIMKVGKCQGQAPSLKEPTYTCVLPFLPTHNPAKVSCSSAAYVSTLCIKSSGSQIT